MPHPCSKVQSPANNAFLLSRVAFLGACKQTDIGKNQKLITEAIGATLNAFFFGSPQWQRTTLHAHK